MGRATEDGDRFDGGEGGEAIARPLGIVAIFRDARQVYGNLWIGLFC